MDKEKLKKMVNQLIDEDKGRDASLLIDAVSKQERIIDDMRESVAPDSLPVLFPRVRHSRVGGNPVITRNPYNELDSVPSFPSEKDMFYDSLIVFRVLHELSIRLTGGGFTIHDYRGCEGEARPSCMATPVKITFETDRGETNE